MKRDEEIEAAAREFLEKDDCPFTSYFEHFLYGAKWADSHPSPEVMVLVGALRGIIEIGKRDMSNSKYNSYFESAHDALANFNKARGEVKP